MKKRKVILPLITVAIIAGAGALTVKTAYAQDLTQYPPIVQKIADKFGLNVTDVQAVFDQDREEHHAQMQAQYEERLNQAVTDGKITEEQKQLILSKQQELMQQHQQDMQDWQNLSVEERQQQRETHKQELQTWAQQNNIDLAYLFGLMGPHRGMRGWQDK